MIAIPDRAPKPVICNTAAESIASPMLDATIAGPRERRSKSEANQRAQREKDDYGNHALPLQVFMPTASSALDLRVPSEGALNPD
jgi:hypothetical protein